MRESEMPLLHVGDPFPPLGLTQPGGEALALPGAFAGNFSVVLFYRGSWCRYCVEQLRAFQRASVRLAEAGIEVAALSVDDETTTAELIGKYGLTFAVGHSAVAIALSAETGAFANLDPPLSAVDRIRARLDWERNYQRLLLWSHWAARTG